MTDAALPALFISHGAPTLPLEDSPASRFLRELGATLPKPEAILVISAHWETDQPTVSAAPKPETIHDFFGFPKALFDMQYPAPGAPDLAREVAEVLGKNDFAVRIDSERGLDHGAWTPLTLMYPSADIPVTQLSVQPAAGPAHHFRVGEALRGLRSRGVLVFASGSATHNLREFRGQPQDSPAASYAVEFGEWMADALQTRDDDALLRYREQAPHAVRNHPTEEHLLPVFVALGAATPGTPAKRLHSSYAFSVIGMDAYRFD